MEFLFYIVACLGVMALSFPLFSIASSMERITSTVQDDDRKPVRARIRIDS